jgi:hypothetical protein
MIGYFLFVYWFQLCWTAKVYIHIGPHKTGSSHIQEFSVTHRSMLAAAGICFPFDIRRTRNSGPKTDNEKHEQLKYINNPWQLMLRNTSNPKYLAHLAPCLKRNVDIFITSEIIASFSPYALSTLRNAFPPTYEIYVIIVYREWLSRVFSQYSELCKRDVVIAEPFTYYMYHNYGELGPTSPYNYSFLINTVLDKLSSKDGNKNNNYLIDYYGIEAQGRDLAYGIFCDIMKVDSFCNFTYNSTKSNEKPDSHNLHLLSVVRNYIYFNKYNFAPKLLESEGRFIRFSKELLSFYSKNESLQKILPIHKSNFRLLHPYALRDDESIHQMYSNHSKIQFLYSDLDANQQSIKSFVAKEIQLKKFYRTNKLLDWLKEEFERLLKEGAITPEKPSTSQRLQQKGRD